MEVEEPLVSVLAIPAEAWRPDAPDYFFITKNFIYKFYGHPPYDPFWFSSDGYDIKEVQRFKANFTHSPNIALSYSTVQRSLPLQT
ncbi:MAG: hypothetical protein L6R38_006025 [Xanthoria sp. 2 TBL-2021]|nr:MAG: hypothetical protein L6R38_006025 [Xanthoria sp. 2 TBL-2021]